MLGAEPNQHLFLHVGLAVPTSCLIHTLHVSVSCGPDQKPNTSKPFIPYTFIIIMYNNTYAVQQCIVYIEAVLCNCYTAKSVPFEMLHKFSFTAYFVAHHKPQSVT
jgi:hypothetical protein